MIVVSNTSPLTNLAAIGQFDLLHRLYPDVNITDGVWDELNAMENRWPKRIITDIIENSKDNNTVAEAMYCQVLWKFASDERDTFEKLKAYYPDSKYVSRLESVVAEREAERRRIE